MLKLSLVSDMLPGANCSWQEHIRLAALGQREELFVKMIMKSPVRKSMFYETEVKTKDKETSPNTIL